MLPEHHLADDGLLVVPLSNEQATFSHVLQQARISRTACHECRERCPGLFVPPPQPPGRPGHAFPR